MRKGENISKIENAYDEKCQISTNKFEKLLVKYERDRKINPRIIKMNTLIY